MVKSFNYSHASLQRTKRRSSEREAGEFLREGIIHGDVDFHFWKCTGPEILITFLLQTKQVNNNSLKH